ncbi:hypothetical protein PIROE2DRAFT_62957 [Piromyces sp. E2]|nr:hypothetical protein PIROE2DRAFT_62957 [Piromyces sp. E2]|eukprot:OUM60743.1 hypothetical protein PIROE2DRAFT_62957 [Piromyces sp. E2]
MGKLQRQTSEKDYFTQEKAFYSRNNISVEKLDCSIVSIDEEVTNTFPNANTHNTIHSGLNSFPSFKNNIDNPVNIKKTINNYTSKHNTLSTNEPEFTIKNKKNNYIDDTPYDSNIENMDYLSSIPNNRINNYVSVNINNNEYSPSHNLNNRSTSNQEVMVNQINNTEEDDSQNIIIKIYKKTINFFYNSYKKFCNIPSVNRFIINRNNYYEEIKKTLFIAISQGLIWGFLFSFIGFFYSNNEIKYSILILFSFVISSVVMSLISSINPVMVKITQISDPIFVVGPLEILIQIYLSVITYKIGMYLL